jgi:hypothetical protein
MIAETVPLLCVAGLTSDLIVSGVAGDVDLSALS